VPISEARENSGPNEEIRAYASERRAMVALARRTIGTGPSGRTSPMKV
jgi:hypothetical protein